MSRAAMKPPTVVVVSYCTLCGKTITADTPGDVCDTSCPYCPLDLDSRVKVARYRLQPTGARR